MNKVYKFDYNYLKLLIDNKDKLLDNDLVILITYIEILQDKLKEYENMKKEMLEIINYYGITEEENDDWFARYIFKEFLSILNKVGGNDEQK